MLNLNYFFLVATIQPNGNSSQIYWYQNLFYMIYYTLISYSKYLPIYLAI